MIVLYNDSVLLSMFILVPLHRIELQIADYKTAVIPFNYKGKTFW